MAEEVADGSADIAAGNSEASPSWDTGLDDYRETIDAKGWKSNADVMQSYVNLEKAVGSDKVPLPSEGSDLAEWEGWSKLGTPNEAAAYELKAPDGYEAYDQTLSDWFREAAFDSKMPASMAQRMHDKYVERMMGNAEQAQTTAADQNEKWETELKQKYGTAYDERIAAAKRALREYGGDEMVEIIGKAGLGSHPVVVETFAKAGIALGHGPQLKDGDTPSSFGTTPEQAREQIAALRTNPGLMDATHPEHKVLNERLERLHQLAFPDAG
jgi:hypothetical protein